MQRGGENDEHRLGGRPLLLQANGDHPGRRAEITYTGVVSGDTFTGTFDLGFAQAPYIGVRLRDDD
jgi:hypothetical protein